MGTTYRGIIDGGNTTVHRISDKATNGRYATRLDARLDLMNHSPTGLSWGYNGSGPAQLALALIADATGDDALALRTYQRFKAEIIAYLDQASGWEMTAEEVAAAARRIEAGRVST